MFFQFHLVMIVVETQARPVEITEGNVIRMEFQERNRKEHLLFFRFSLFQFV